MNEEKKIECVLRQMREIENSLLSRGLTWDEEYSEAYSIDLNNASEEVIDNLTKRYKGKYNLKDRERYQFSWENNTPLVRITLLDGNDYESEIEPKEYEVGFKRIDWKNIISSSAERSFAFNNYGYIDFEKDTTLEDYYGKYRFYGSFNPFSKNFKISVSRNYVDRGFEVIETAVLEKYGPNLSITYNDIGKIFFLDNCDTHELTQGKEIDIEEIEKRVEKAKAMVDDVKHDILIPGLVEMINYCLNKLDEKEKSDAKESRAR